MSFPPGTEMFQFPGFASRAYGFGPGSPSRGGFPHSDIRGSTIARISPRLFAACHVLHRLLAPRHPPNALITLQITPSPPARRTKPRPARDSAAHLSHSHSQTTQLFPDKLVKDHTSPANAEHRPACLLEAGPTGRMVEAMRPVALISTRTQHRTPATRLSPPNVGRISGHRERRAEPA